jgi:ligand-binding sensor domain-containing protein/signal transduction histidine kinase
MMMRVLLGCLWFLAGSHRVAADDSAQGRSNSPAWSAAPIQYASRVWQTEDGLPNNRVLSLAQTLDGYLWAGTHDGLVRFDGVEFTVYNADNTPALTNDSISALCAGRDGSLYVGTGDGLVTLKEGAFSRLGTNNGLAGNTVTSIFQSKQGAVWIGTTAGLSRYENHSFTNYTTADGLLGNVIRCVIEDRDGALWVATPRGLNCLRNGTVEQFTTNNGLPQTSVRSLCLDTNGALWISFDHGVATYDGRGFVAHDLPGSFSRNYVPALCSDSRGNIWVGAYDGLSRFEQGRFQTQVNNAGVSYDQINALLEDREGNIWAGSREGLARLTPRRIFVYDVTSGLSLNNVMSVLQDRDGSLWLGTWGGGLNHISGTNVSVYARTNSHVDDLVLALCQGTDGSIWAGMDFDGGIVRIKDGRIHRYTVNQGLPPVAIKVLHDDRTGRLWIGTAHGLYGMSNGKIKNFGVKNTFLRSAVHAICEDARGSIWIGADAGLGCWADGIFTQFTSDPQAPRGPINAALEDEAGNLWVATPRQGIFRYRSGKFTAYTKEEGLPGNEIFELLDDGGGSLWMSTDDGIFRVFKKDLEALDQHPQGPLGVIAYRRSDGLQSTEGGNVAKPSAWKTRDGRLLFATTKGLAVIDPKSERINQTAPPVYIEEVKAGSKPVWQSRPLASIMGQTTPEFPVGRGEMEFSFAALSYANPDKCRFRYKLEGADSDWTAPDTKRTAKYNNLSPGHYRFSVMACNGDGVWNERGASLAFYLAPHFWQTPWFRLLCVTLILGSVAGAARALTRRRMQRQLELLEQQHALERERGRIAKDIHDDLGSSLTRIMLLGTRAEQDLVEQKEIQPQLRKIVASCGDTIQAMDEIVWAVNPENDTLDGLVGYLGQYTEQFFEDTPIKCRFKLPIESHSFGLPAEVRHDLFLAVKEALHNVLKHSSASEVLVQVSVQDETMKIGIEDNGRGFAANQAGGGRKGNGLENIRRRLERHGGRFEVTGGSGKGTKLSLVLRVKQKYSLFNGEDAPCSWG